MSAKADRTPVRMSLRFIDFPLELHFSIRAPALQATCRQAFYSSWIAVEALKKARKLPNQYEVNKGNSENATVSFPDSWFKVSQSPLEQK